MNETIKNALLNLFERHSEIWKAQKECLPLQPFDEQWLSACQVERVEDEMITWSPIVRDASINLHNIEEALDLTLHPSIHALFCSFYAGGIACLFEGHPIELIQAWNEDDFKLLQENMIAHFLMQKRLKKPASMFIASCSDETQVISILNDTGEVQLETLGKKQEAILAPNLLAFLAKLQPVVAHQD